MRRLYIINWFISCLKRCVFLSHFKAADSENNHDSDKESSNNSDKKILEQYHDSSNEDVEMSQPCEQNCINLSFHVWTEKY